MMDLDEEEKEAGEILRSLLATPKMQNHQQNEVDYWQPSKPSWHQPQRHCQPPEQVVWQTESNEANKQQFVTNSHNIVQHIPVTYLAADNRNLTFTNARPIKNPVTYVLSRNVIAETAKYCTINTNEGNIIINEPQKIVFVQEVNGNVAETEPVFSDDLGRVFRVDGNGADNKVTQNSYEEVSGNGDKVTMVGVESEFVQNSEVNVEKSEVRPKSDKVEGRRRKKKKTETDFGGQSLSEAGEKEESVITNKPKVGKKISGNKKSLTKRKNSKLKNKLKSAGKPLVKKSKNNVKSTEYDKSDEKFEGEKSRGNLFELTKLEDNADQVAERFKIGCECSDSNCFDGLNPENVFKHRLNIADLTKAEHDMYLMGVIMASIQNPDETSRHKERIRIRSCYAYQGKKVCLTAFLYLQHVTLYQMKRLRSHLKYHGVSPRIHGNHGRKPANTLSLDIYRRATNFIQNYIEKHCVKSVPNFTTFSSNKIGSTFLSGSSLNIHDSKSAKKSNKVKIANKMTSYHLPAECTKKIVHREYKSFCEGLKPSQKVMQYSTFTNFLKKQFPNVKFQKVDKKQEDKCSHVTISVLPEDVESKPPKRPKKPSEEDAVVDAGVSADKCVQTPTQVYIPAKAVHFSQPTTFVMAPRQNAQVCNRTTELEENAQEKNHQIILNGQHLQFYSGSNENDLQSDLRFPNQVLLGNQIYSAQCVCQSSGNTQQIYAMDNINN